MINYALIYETLFPTLNEYLLYFDENIEAYNNNPVSQLTRAFSDTFRQSLLPFARQQLEELTSQDYLRVAYILLSNEGTYAAMSSPLIARLRSLLPSDIIYLYELGFLNETNLALVGANSSPEFCAYALRLAFLERYETYQAAHTSIEKILYHNDTYHLAMIFGLLKQMGQLNSQTVSIVLSKPFHRHLHHGLNHLHAEQLYCSELVPDLLSTSMPIDFAQGAVILQRAGLVTRETINLLKYGCECFGGRFIDVIEELQTSHFLTSENMITASNRCNQFNCDKIAGTFRTLKIANLLNQVIITTIFNHDDVIALDYSCRTLLSAGLLNAQHLADVLKSHSPVNLAGAFVALNGLRLLTSKNRKSLVKLRKRALDTCVWMMNSAMPNTQSFNQANLDLFITHSKFISFFNRSGVRDDIPPGSLTQAHLDGLFLAYTQANGNAQQALAAIRNYVYNRLLGMNQPNQTNIINAHQSTHTASVHKSASESAIRLQKKYPYIAIDDTIAHIVTWVNALDTTSSNNTPDSSSTLQNAAAQRAINRLCTYNSLYGGYRDKTSQTTTLNLLALIWHAVHDEQNRSGTLEDAKMLLRDALYECQREYNLDARGRDHNPTAEDSPACAAGTFNKLIEKMQGVLPQVEIRMITKEMASLKLPIVVKDVLAAYLRDHNNREKLIYSIIEDGVETVWGEIKQRVAEEMFAEFGSLFGSNIQDPQLIALVETGIYIAVDKEWLDNIPKAKPQTSSPLSPVSLFQHPSSSSSSTQYNDDNEPAPKRRKIN
jgi:hypothetical protein